MNVVAAGPLPVGSVLWQTGAGSWTLTVVARATFLLLPGESTLAPEQEAPRQTDLYWNDDERCSLRAAGDLVPFKKRADVLLVGQAYAPRGQPVRSLLARLVVGSVDKSVEVFGDRAFARDGALQGGAPFVTMPLYWERAAGGPGTDNPVGRRLDVTDERGMTLLPNLQPPGLNVTRRPGFVPPVGFGPIAPWWPLRRGKLGHRLASWDFRRWSLAPLPADLDAAFFNAAPDDQQLDTVQPSERIVLEHLHPEHARLVTSLTAIRPRALFEPSSGTAQEYAMACDTLTIDTHRGTCALTWRGRIPIAQPRDGDRVLVIVKHGGGPRISSGTVAASTSPAPALPFVKPELGPPARADAPGPAERLPPAAPPPPYERAPDTWDLPITTSTLAAGPVDVAPALPFRPAHGPIAEALDPAAPRSAIERHEEPAVPEQPVPPTMLGPLATPEMCSGSVASGDEGGPRPDPAGPVAPADAEPPTAPPEEIPVERCAAIAASIARRETERPRILEENELTAQAWEAVERHWDERIREETDRGKTGLLRAYDAAYVARLEEERGSITVDEHARLVVAAERRRVDMVTRELELPPAAFMRIRRVFIARSAADAALGEGVRRAIALERDR